MSNITLQQDQSQIGSLIHINKQSINNEAVQTVDARDLHAYLEVKSRFNDWIRNRIKEYNFLEEVDYITVTKNLVSGGSQIDYFISLDMAKELSMVERNEKGKQARQYFIECEKKAKQDPMKALNDPTTMRGLLLTYSEKVIELEHKVEEMRDDVDAFERIAKSDGSLNLTSTAKHLQQHPHKFNQLLNKEGWIYKRKGQRNWLGYQDKVKQGLLEHKVYITQDSSGYEKICEQVLVTPKGLTKLSQMLSIH